VFVRACGASLLIRSYDFYDQNGTVLSRKPTTGRLADQLADKVADLRIRQLFAPSASETRFSTMKSTKLFYHFPIPNNQTLRLYPLCSDLIKTLTAQSTDYTALNNCCYALAKCSNSYYAAHRTEFDKQAHQILASWNKSIAERVYHNTSGFFRALSSQCQQTIDITSVHYSSLENRLALLPLGLTGIWQFSIISLKSDLEALLLEIADCPLYKEDFLHFVEIKEFKVLDHPATEIVNLYIDAGLDCVALLEVVDTIKKYRYRINEERFGHDYHYSYALEPGLSLQQGFFGLKQFLSTISRLDSYYVKESAYSLTRQSDLQLLKQWACSHKRSRQPGLA
jgi:hypothetical protein